MSSSDSDCGYYHVLKPKEQIPYIVVEGVPYVPVKWVYQKLDIVLAMKGQMIDEGDHLSCELQALTES